MSLLVTSPKTANLPRCVVIPKVIKVINPQKRIPMYHWNSSELTSTYRCPCWEMFFFLRIHPVHNDQFVVSNPKLVEGTICRDYELTPTIAGENHGFPVKSFPSKTMGIQPTPDRWTPNDRWFIRPDYSYWCLVVNKPLNKAYHGWVNAGWGAERGHGCHPNRLGQPGEGHNDAPKWDGWYQKMQRKTVPLSMRLKLQQYTRGYWSTFGTRQVSL